MEERSSNLIVSRKFERMDKMNTSERLIITTEGHVSLAVPNPSARLDIFQQPPHGRKVTAEEWQSIIESDPIVGFHERVCIRALADPLWHENYALATYR